MNLNGIAAPYAAAVTPQSLLRIRVSNGYTVAADGQPVPAYFDEVSVRGSVQALSYSDIQHLDGLNIQGERRAIYINGRIDGLVRPDKKGGDLIRSPDGHIWLVALVLEYWQDWCKVAATLQIDKTWPQG